MVKRGQGEHGKDNTYDLFAIFCTHLYIGHATRRRDRSWDDGYGGGRR